MIHKTLCFLLGCCACIFIACNNQQPSTPPDTPESLGQETTSGPETEQELLEDPLGQATESIQDILENYYSALEDENIDEAQFFAPTVKKFYNQVNQNREKIGQSIRNGFQAVENRSISFDPNSLEVTTNNDGFVAEFEGEVSFIRSSDKSTNQEQFRNRVGFDKNFKIISYEAVDINRPNIARQLSPASRDAIAASTLMKAFVSGDKSMLDKFIHPELGLYYVTHPGAMDNVEWCQKIDQVLNNRLTPYASTRLEKLDCELQFESLPEFDCDKFSKEGCFMDEVSGYGATSKLMQTLIEADLGKFSADDIAKARRIESFISRQMVATSALTALYLGEIDGKWYLLVVDTASYDCSA